MNERVENVEDRFKIYLTSVGLYFAIGIMFIIHSSFLKNVNMQYVMIAGVIASGIVTVAVSKVKGFKWEYVMYSIIAIGFIMRIGYMLYTPATVRSHDLGWVSPEKGHGHAAYVLLLYKYHQLPTSNVMQFYQPPLYYIISGITIAWTNIFLRAVEYEQLFEAAKIVSCFASCASVIICAKLCRELGLSKKAACVATGIIAVFPNCYLLAGRVNNDSLVVFFMMVIVLYTIKWYREQSWFHTIILALGFGLGMMTKISCGILAFFTGPIMLYVWVKKIKEKNGLSVFKKLVGFGAISFPLGLWYAVRNYVLFQQPLNYVMKISEEEEIYKGYVPLLERFFQFPVSKLLNPVFNQPQKDYNVNIYVLKGGVFGEFSYNVPLWIAKGLLLASTAVVFISLFAMVYLVFKSKKEAMMRFAIPGLWLVVYGSFLYFYYQYPYGCSMDFRYIVPTAFTGALSIAGVFDCALEGKSVKAICYKWATLIFISIYAIFSIMMFCVIK